jgi:uncharacterized membrane protein SpoIIM required for sporulation
MAESPARFVQRRRPDWDALEQLLVRGERSALRLEEVEQLDRLHRRAASDLAHVQAHFPASDVERFLHQLLGRVITTLYRPPLEPGARLTRFYAETFPQALRAVLPQIGVSAGLFVLGLLLGAVVVLLEPRGAELLVPEHLRRAIAAGRLWTDDLLSVMPPSVAAGAIATNNLTVTIAAFATGLLAGLGTVFLLVNNGLMIGAVAAACARGGMLGALLDFIGAHGPVELSIIVIAGGAGLRLGQAVIAPGELPRGQALRLGAREGVTLVLGCAPFLAAIGVVEGFISPGALFPTWAKALLGVALGAAFWGYVLTAASATRRTGGLTEAAAARRSAWAWTRS